MPDAEHSWTCRVCIDYDQLHSQLNTASRTCAAAQSPTVLVGDHSVSKTKQQSQLTVRASTPMFTQLLQLMSQLLTSWCLLQDS